MIESIHSELTKLEVFTAQCRVWIYQSNRNLNTEEVSLAQFVGNGFIQEWNSHGSPMSAGFLVLYNRFIVIIADESFVAASGCSIDSSVKVIRDLERKFGITLLDRMNLAYRLPNGPITSEQLSTFTEKIKTKEISGTTIVFNNLVENIGQMKKDWEVPLAQSWHKNLL